MKVRRFKIQRARKLNNSIKAIIVHRDTSSLFMFSNHTGSVRKGIIHRYNKICIPFLQRIE